MEEKFTYVEELASRLHLSVLFSLCNNLVSKCHFLLMYKSIIILMNCFFNVQSIKTVCKSIKSKEEHMLQECFCANLERAFYCH